MDFLTRFVMNFDLKRFRKENNISQKKLSDILGVGQPFISQIENGKDPMPAAFMSKLADIYNISEYTQTGNNDEVKAKKLHINVDTSYSLVPLYNLDARGGFDSNSIVDTAEYVDDYIPFKDAKKGDICVPVTGKSMIPTYYPGSVILLHEIEQWREFIEMGQIYVIILKDGRRLLKELKHGVDDRKNNFLCVSHNPEIEPVELPKDLIFKVYLVTALYQKTTM